VTADGHSAFAHSAAYWHDVYDSVGLDGLVYRRRMDLALDWIGPASASGRAPRALDAGCGAGRLSVALAQRGYEVDAIDASPAMLARADRLAAEAGVASAVHTRAADVHAMPFADARFDVVVALGVLPWVESPPQFVAEIARVLKPGGRLVTTADNRVRLNRMLDPRLSPFLYRVRQLRWALQGRPRPAREVYRLHWPRSVGELLDAAGLVPVRRATVGFGPLSLLGRSLLSERATIAVHERLQRQADRGLPGLRSMGTHVVVEGRRPEGGPLPSSSA
jgi:SAM-dependent methyltransferase